MTDDPRPNPLGLFDKVTVECLIPGIVNPAVIAWQTKDFPHPWLREYRINGVGALLRERLRYESPKGRNAQSVFAHISVPVHDGWEKIEYDGDVRLSGDDDGKHVRVVARFAAGSLVSIAHEQSPPAGPYAFDGDAMNDAEFAESQAMQRVLAVGHRVGWAKLEEAIQHSSLGVPPK